LYNRQRGTEGVSITSRSQQTATYNAASGENEKYNRFANTSFANAKDDIADYASAVGKSTSPIPYAQGRQAETAENQEIADTDAGMAQSAGQTLQGQALRTGHNAGGAIAATEYLMYRKIKF